MMIKLSFNLKSGISVLYPSELDYFTFKEKLKDKNIIFSKAFKGVNHNLK